MRGASLKWMLRAQGKKKKTEKRKRAAKRWGKKSEPTTSNSPGKGAKTSRLLAKHLSAKHMSSLPKHRKKKRRVTDYWQKMGHRHKKLFELRTYHPLCRFLQCPLVTHCRCNCIATRITAVVLFSSDQIAKDLYRMIQCVSRQHQVISWSKPFNNF